jgi:hypothetical protein
LPNNSAHFSLDANAIPILRAGKNLEAMNRKFAATVAVLIVLLTSGAVRAQLLPDVILLKSGEKVEGRITEESGLSVTISTTTPTGKTDRMVARSEISGITRAPAMTLMPAEQTEVETEKKTVQGETKNAIEAPSPDGKFAFRYTRDSNSETQTYDLIEKQSGKLLRSVAESDPDPAPSARFNMDVLWKPDSKAFALTATLWKRGSHVAVYMRDGSTFREIKLPKLVADIPDKIKAGKSFPHIAELNSQSATAWQKDGSLVVEIENMVDGEDGSITATRTVVLGFDRSDKAKVLKSTIKFETSHD